MQMHAHAHISTSNISFSAPSCPCLARWQLKIIFLKCSNNTLQRADQINIHFNLHAVMKIKFVALCYKMINKNFAVGKLHYCSFTIKSVPLAVEKRIHSMQNNYPATLYHKIIAFCCKPILPLWREEFPPAPAHGDVLDLEELAGEHSLLEGGVGQYTGPVLLTGRDHFMLHRAPQ